MSVALPGGDNYEPMQVDPEENDNDEGAGMGPDVRLAHQVDHPMGPGGPDPMGRAANGAPGIMRGGGGGLAAGALPQGELHGEDVRVFYNIENPSIDLETYVQGYSGLSRLYRLRFIAHHCPVLRIEALKLGIHHVQQTHNTMLFAELHKALAAAQRQTPGDQGMPSISLPDVAAGAGAVGAGSISLQLGANVSTGTSGLSPALLEWIETRSKKAALKLEKLDTDLKNYKSNSIKESIRRGHDDLGDHFLDCGDLSNALKCYSRARDYCTSGRHVVNMCVNVIRVCVYLQNWSHVISYVNKATATPDFSDGNLKNHDHQTLLTRLHCAYGLAELAMRKYKSAAKRFLDANLDYCDIPDLMSTQNVATYGGLCALATFERAELHKQVITSSTFKLFLELDPQLREVILSFHDSKYGKCLKLLDDIKDNLLLDLYLASHVNQLYSMIRNRSLVQYFSPYLSADLRLMASSFNTTVNQLEDELMALILDGQIQARIDSHNKVLYSQDVDQRNATFERAMEMGHLYQRRARMLVLRSAILKNNIMVKTVTRGGGPGGGMMGEPPELGNYPSMTN